MIPELAKTCAHVYVFQRSPAWCDRKDDGPLGAEYWEGEDGAGGLHAGDGATYDVVRAEMLDGHEVSQAAKMDPPSNEERQRQLREELHATVADPAVAALLEPSYPIGCKRVCCTDFWRRGVCCCRGGSFELQHRQLCV